MTDKHDKHDKQRSPHGVTGDTVRQAAEVSKPTSDVGRALDDPRVPQAPSYSKVDPRARESAAIAGKPGGPAKGQ